METLEHLLFKSELASTLWRFFVGLLQVEVLQDLVSIIKGWFEMARLTSYRGTLIGLLPGFLCWYIWRERCFRRFSSMAHSPMQVIFSIIADCNCIHEGKKFKFFGGDTSSLARYGF